MYDIPPPPEIVAPLRPYDPLNDHTELGLCVLCTRTLTASWYQTRDCILLRMKGHNVCDVARALERSPTLVRILLKRAGTLSATGYEITVAMTQNRYRISEREMLEAGGTLTDDGRTWRAPLVHGRGRAPRKKVPR